MGSPRLLRRRLRRWTHTWVTTSGKNGWSSVSRWSLIVAAFSRKDKVLGI